MPQPNWEQVNLLHVQREKRQAELDGWVMENPQATPQMQNQQADRLTIILLRKEAKAHGIHV